MIICDQPPIAYFAPTKTGTSTVEQTLADAGIDIKIGRALKHDLAVPEAVQDMDDDGYFFMITLRNPYSRAVSMWSHFCKPLPTGKRVINIESDLTQDSKGKDFRHWVDTVLLSDKATLRYRSYFRTQSEYLAAMPRIDAKLRTETLSRDLLQLPFIAKEKTTIPTKHVGPYREHSHWKDYYADDPGLVAAVKSRFEADFESAGYSPNFEEAT